MTKSTTTTQTTNTNNNNNNNNKSNKTTTTSTTTLTNSTEKNAASHSQQTQTQTQNSLNRKSNSKQSTPNSENTSTSSKSTNNNKMVQWDPSNYVKSIVYGGLDGIITMFAMVCSISGGHVEPHILLVVGMANMLADAASMALGDFLSTKADLENDDANHRRRLHLLESDQEGQKKLLTEHYIRKGFSEKDSQTLTSILSKNRESFLKSMESMEEDSDEKATSPTVSAMWTFLAFVGFGIIPLTTYLLAPMWLHASNETTRFWLTVVLTGGTLWALGAMKARVIYAKFQLQGANAAGLEIAIAGGLASLLSYLIAWVLSGSGVDV